MNAAPHAGIFGTWNELLQRQGSGIPRLLVDLDALDTNISSLLELQPARRIRLVVKSLPSLPLLDYIGGRLWSDSAPFRLMAFHLPFVLQVARHYPDADILMGKPLPVGAMARFYQALDDPERRPAAQPSWLVDTPARLAQVVRLADELSLRLNVSLELDVGMHRGGVAGDAKLIELLAILREHTERLRLTGFMGYDAHAAKAPWPWSPRRACSRSASRYRTWLDTARARFADLEESPWCVNGAGSPTVTLHGDDSPLNDFSVGSALLKPAAFDLDSLAAFRPAAWIATPVLKRCAGVRLPFLEVVPSIRRDTLFLYGGRWMARPASPPGLRESRLYGRSSNQQMMTIPSASALSVDDFAFFRPEQSEAVLLQFGDLLAVRGSTAEAEWRPLDNTLPGSRRRDR